MKTYVLFSSDLPSDIRLLGPGLGLPYDIYGTYERSDLEDYSQAELNFLGPSAVRLLHKLFKIDLVVNVRFDSTQRCERIVINYLSDIVPTQSACNKIHRTIARHLNGLPTHIRCAPDLAALNQLIAELATKNHLVRP